MPGVFNRNGWLRLMSGAVYSFFWLMVLEVYHPPIEAWWNAWWLPLAIFAIGGLAATMTRPATKWLIAVHAVSFVLFALWATFGPAGV